MKEVMVWARLILWALTAVLAELGPSFRFMRWTKRRLWRTVLEAIELTNV